MTRKGRNRIDLLGGLLLGAVSTFTGCESKGPAQQAGENVDNAIRNAKDKVNPPGPAEKAARSVDKAFGK